MKPQTIPVNCQRGACRGVLFNVTARLALALGVLHLRCDKCKHTTVYKVAE